MTLRKWSKPPFYLCTVLRIFCLFAVPCPTRSFHWLVIFWYCFSILWPSSPVTEETVAFAEWSVDYYWITPATPLRLFRYSVSVDFRAFEVFRIFCNVETFAFYEKMIPMKSNFLFLFPDFASTIVSWCMLSSLTLEVYLDLGDRAVFDSS